MDVFRRRQRITARAVQASNVYPIFCGTIGPEGAGWFRKEIKTVNDLKGLKMRFFGLGAKVMDKLGVSTQLLAPGDIFQALQLGTIDATEFSIPSIDQPLGFYRVAKYYYFPGWHQPASFFDLFVNKGGVGRPSRPAPGHHRDRLRRHGAPHRRRGRGDAVGGDDGDARPDGVLFKRWSPEILVALQTAWNEVVAEESAANPNFRHVYDSYAAFRDNYALWHDYGFMK